MRETIRDINFGRHGWRFVVRDEISPEFVVAHLMRASAFHVRTRTRDETALVGRDVKDALVDNAVI